MGNNNILDDGIDVVEVLCLLGFVGWDSGLVFLGGLLNVLRSSRFNLFLRLLSLEHLSWLAVLNLKLFLDDKAVVDSVLREVSGHIGCLTVTKVVLGVLFVSSKDFNGRRALDAILGGQATVGHHVNGTESNPLVFELIGDLGLRDLLSERFAVWAPVGVESDHPSVITVHDLVFP